MNRLIDKDIIIAPKTAMSVAFKNYLDSTIDYTFNGFSDKNKKDDDITPLCSINAATIDAYIIVSPNHHRSIYDDALNYIDPHKIYIISIENQCYSLSQTINHMPEDCIKELSHAYDQNEFIRSRTCFISKGFIGGNNKYFYLYCLRNGISCTIVTDNKKQLSELKQHNLPAVDLEEQTGYKTIAEAKYLIFDQGNFTNFYISPQQITLQLWHGVGLKKMAPQKHITYDYFISTSHWTNETNFKNIFSAHNFLDCGYPRNDFLVQDGEDALDLLFCDYELYLTVKNKHFNKVVVYMPTTREYLFGSNSLTKKDLLPLNLEKLNSELAITNTLFIIKLHPFILEFFDYSPDKSAFSHIRFHTPDGDIYPILKYADILVSDYSSVVYDFMLLDRPIIIFDYDRATYEDNMGGFLFDFDEYSPSACVSNEDDLLTLITKLLYGNDNSNEHNKNILSLFLGNTPLNSCDKILSLLKGFD